ncbi:glycoside hydrolase family 115 protein [Ceratobasidium sp. AG-Ba]|nr:glycoside hydrolase family 115 protein [Ceratobasidium sp. AG-Ba]
MRLPRSWLFVLAALKPILAISTGNCVSFDSKSGGFQIAATGSAKVLVAPDEWPGVVRAAGDFAKDLSTVTGKTLSVANVTETTAAQSKPPIIVGTLGHSALISAVVNNSKIDVSGISGKWESFIAQPVSNPLPGISSAYVVIGSDKRGTIFGLYELTEQSGVSPWYWWADVPIQKHSTVYFTGNCSQGEPTVKYRGIFINDEQPAIQSWAQEKYTNGTGPPFNHLFYANVFELLLRLRANYLWPAMWSGMFYVDDSANAALADYYGIVMGTSHQEPMARSTPNEWNRQPRGPWNFTSNAANVKQYWVEGVQRAAPYETLYTLGMRGEGDLPLEESTNIQNLEDVVAAQRQILAQVYNKTDATTIPQMWCLYKEVQSYYGYIEDGMRVPDDVILLWADDNWGNIRRFPLDNERNRTGGAGVYYHFDYVGDPRDYKWIQSTQLEKVHEQMTLASDRGANSIWIVNVGDIKPYEMAIEYFIALGRNVNRWRDTTPSSDSVQEFITQWATREFNLPSKSNEIAQLVRNMTRFNARRKHELLNTTTYSLINYHEAESIVATWDDMVSRSQAIYKSLPSGTQPAYFQLVHHPIQASSIVQNLYYTVGRNNLYASQARLSTNLLADQAVQIFNSDYDLEAQYHSLLNGKWDHFMDQTHLGYYYWQQPMTNTMPAVNRVASKKQALAGPMRITIEGSLGAWPGDNSNQCAQGYNCPPPSLPPLDPYTPGRTRFIDISAGGPNTFSWSASSNASWLSLSPSSGSVSASKPDTRMTVSVDWSKLGSGAGYASISIKSASSKQVGAATSVTINLAAYGRSPASGFKGFVEGDGGVSIEAIHPSRNSTVNGVAWHLLPGLGRTNGAVTPQPALGNGGNAFSVGSGPSLEYDFYTFNTPASGNVTLTSYISPALNGNGNNRPVGFAVQIDSGAPQSIYYSPVTSARSTPAGWGGNDGWVANSIVNIQTKHTVSPGAHTLKVWMLEPAVVLQKFVIDTGGVRSSYLGPPESIRV